MPKTLTMAPSWTGEAFGLEGIIPFTEELQKSLSNRNSAKYREQNFIPLPRTGARHGEI